MDYRYMASSTAVDIIDADTEALVKRLNVNAKDQVTCLFDNDQAPPWKKEREIEECAARAGRPLKKVTLFNRIGQEQLEFAGSAFAILELGSDAPDRPYTWLITPRSAS
jgi:hypothetical protein